jgi:hypothetical protein
VFTKGGVEFADVGIVDASPRHACLKVIQTGTTRGTPPQSRKALSWARMKGNCSFRHIGSS